MYTSDLEKLSACSVISDSVCGGISLSASGTYYVQKSYFSALDRNPGNGVVRKNKLIGLLGWLFLASISLWANLIFPSSYSDDDDA